jgi:hypothetical protein
LCASIALSRLGVATMLVERHLTVSSFPRSRTVHQRAMEIFRQWGLEEAVYAREVEAEPLMVWAETVAAPPSRQADYVQDSDPTRDHQWVLNAEDPALAGDPAGAVLRAIGADVPVEILGTPASWIAAAQLADRFRAGPVFLAGDAAHRLTPAGGMGMNTGVQDVHNLAWKLAAVLHGHAGEALLDTYEAERRPAAARNVAWSLDNWTSLRARKPWPSPGNPNTEAIDLGAVYKSAAVVQDQMQDVEDGLERVPSGRPGGRAPHLWFNGPAGPQSTLDLFDRRFTLLTAPAGRAWAEPAAAPTRAPGVPFDVVTITNPRWADAYGVASDGAALVRPDGHVGWRGRSCSRDSLADLAATLGAIVARAGTPFPTQFR